MAQDNTEDKKIEIKPWYIYKNPGKSFSDLPAPPHWREFPGTPPEIKRSLPEDIKASRRFRVGKNFQANSRVIETVNTALYLRRPLLITGAPGIGKSSLAYSIAHNLKLGRVLRWPITSRTTIRDGLYAYDAIGRLQESNLLKDSKEKPDIGSFITLGPLGTALLPTKYPRVLLIDEIDKSDVDLPNDLLNMFEEGEFEIPELVRLKDEEVVFVRPDDAENREDTVPIHQGQVQCSAFPIIVLTSNKERDLPPAFLRRCLQLEMNEPSADQLKGIVNAHFDETKLDEIKNLQKIIDTFVERRKQETLATDQLLNAISLVINGTEIDLLDEAQKELLNTVFRPLRA